MKSARFTVAAIQMACGKDTGENLRHACELVGKAAKAGATVVCLPELFRSQYFCQSQNPDTFDLAEPLPGPSVAALQPVAWNHKAVVVVPVFERRAPGLYHNSVAVIDANGDIAGIYRKMHIPDDPLFFEKYYFTPGDLGFRVFDTAHAKIGTLICWDQWYPEGARITALLGANILLYPTAIGWHPAEKKQFGTRQHSAWETIQRSHAIANGVFVAAVNRVGHEGPKAGGIEFWGGSFICDPFGEVLARAPHDREETIFAECDPALQEETRRNWPFLRDRRIDAYGPILERYLDR